MKTGILRKGGQTLVEHVRVADRFWLRAWGLLGRSGLPAHEALFLAPCSAIHTFFMRFDLDLIFVSRGMGVVKVVRGVRPFRMVAGGPLAWGVLEMEAGWLAADSVQPGDEFSLLVP